MVIKEWVCMAHGNFDGPEQRCPKGCGDSMVQRAFRTAPAIQSAGFRSVNKSVEMLAKQQGITDINQRGGDGMRMTDWRAEKRMAQSMEMMGHGTNSGVDMGQFFAPLSAMAGRASAPPSVIKENGVTVVAGTGVPLNTPGAIVAGRHDGIAAGVPLGD
jgi:hypothetical protein